MTIKFSIIMVAYNSQKYIQQSINSVLLNNYDNVEIIIVDDGSTDATVSTVKKFCNKKIRLLRTNHLGTANARNLGLKNITGDYVLFLDSDDVIDANALQIISKSINKEAIDFIVFKWLPFKYIPEDSFGEPQGMLSILGMDTTLWNKVYSKKLISQLHFPKDTIYEDVAFSIQAYLVAKKRVFIDQVFYYYRQHADSVTKKKQNPLNRLDIITDFNGLILDIQSNKYKVSNKELSDIGLVIHELVYAHAKCIFRDNLSDSNATYVLNQFYKFLKKHESILGTKFYINKFKNIKAKFLFFCIKMNWYKLAYYILKFHGKNN